MTNELIKLLEEGKVLHLEILNVSSNLIRQDSMPCGMRLVALKEFRNLTTRAKKLDQTIRAVTIEKTKEILVSNAEKRGKKR